MRQQRSITISDVAREAGVSKATASVALRSTHDSSETVSSVRIAPETRRRILLAAEQLGYERNALALALSQGRTYTIGLVSQLDSSVAKSSAAINAYQKDVMIAVTCACARAGLRMTTILVSSSGTTNAAAVADGRVDGAILATLRDDDLARDVFRRGFPAVTIGSGYSERRVAPDNRGGIEAAIEHLAGLGHRRIAYITFPPADSWTTQERLAGYHDAMARRGWPALTLRRGELDNAFAVPPSERPTACVCFNDVAALEVQQWARKRGLSVPTDLSVIGFDDGAVAQYADPCLTTVENPLDPQADIAIALLQSLWRGEPAIAPPPVPTRLIVRESTAAAPYSP